MQFGQIIKRAWSITWRNKNLWWLGLFAGSGAASFNYSSGSDFTNSGNGSSPNLPWSWSQIESQLGLIIPIVIAVIVFLMLLWFAMLIIQVAARGGLIVQAAVADDGQRPLARRGWGNGFHRWWPLALMMALIALPILLIVLFMLVVVFFAVALPALQSGGTPNVAALVGMVGLFIGVAIVMIPLSLVLSVLELLASREVMLAELGPWDSIKAAWHLVRTRFKDVALFWLLMFAIGVGFGMAIFVVTLLIVLVGIGVGVGAVISSQKLLLPVLIGAAVLMVPFLIALTVIGAAYATFQSTAWTLFWRRVTGRIVDAMPAPQPAPAVAGTPMPPYATEYPATPPMPPQPTEPQPTEPQPPAPSKPPAPPAPPVAPPPIEPPTNPSPAEPPVPPAPQS